MLKRLLPVVLLLSACQPNAANDAHQRRVQLLDAWLMRANTLADKTNRKTVDDLRALVLRQRFSDAQDKRAWFQLVEHSDSIRAAASTLVAHIRETRRQLSTRTLGSAKGSTPAVLLGTRQDGLAYAVLRQLLAYRARLRALDTLLVLPKLAPVQAGADSSTAALANFYFEETTPAEALAGLAQLEAKVLADEAVALQAQAARIGCAREPIYDTTGVFAGAESNTVIAGTEYRANLLLVTQLRPTVLQMTLNGQAIPVSENGIGTIRFVADPALLGSRPAVQAYWTGSIRVQDVAAKSGDTTYKVHVPYRIVRGNYDGETNKAGLPIKASRSAR